MVELADTLDSKSSEAYPSCGFKSHLRHQVRISHLVALTSQIEYKILPIEGFEAELSASYGGEVSENERQRDRPVWEDE